MNLHLTAQAGGRTARHLLPDSGSAEVHLGDLAAATTVIATSEPGAVSLRTVASRPWEADLELTAVLDLPAAVAVLWPAYQGQYHRRPGDADAVTYEFRGPGWNAPAHDDRRLALPAAILQTTDGYQVVGTDPGYSAHLTIAGGRNPRAQISWTYRHQAGAHDLTRRVITAIAGTPDEALDRWFALATPDVPPGPQWLQEIAWTNYDYMSKNGTGWYQDIDAFCDLAGPPDHHRAAFTLHAWYDQVGRYCYDPASGALDERWTVFPYIGDPRLTALQGHQQPDGTHPPGYTMRNLADYHPLEMTWEDIETRLRYAKDRGLRVPFYLATGMMAIGSQAEHKSAGDGLESELALWVGPDSVGETYLMNPLHPDVRARFLGLTSAILDRVGDLIDALVIDEAYFVGYGQLGPAACPGYADLAQAELLRDMAALCHARRPDIALLTADHLGTQALEHQAYPYCLYTDGIYHDAWCHPQTFDAGRFPASRGVVWSCNWAPSTAIANTKWAVLAYGAPVTTSNGCFGDDLGLAEMPASDKATLLSLWHTATSRTFLRPPVIIDVPDAARPAAQDER